MKFKLFGIIWDLKPVVDSVVILIFCLIFCAGVICVLNEMMGWAFFWFSLGCILSYIVETLEL